MIWLYFFLDILFYNFTPWKTNLILLSLYEKENSFFYFFSCLLLDIFLQGYGRWFLLFLGLYFLSKKMKRNHFKTTFYSFILLYLLYTVFILLFFQVFSFSTIGILINFLFLFISYKNRKPA